MRFVVARRMGKRGAGLGNEILPWAKGWIASQILNARLVGPSWGINPRRYDRNFQTSRLDFLLEDVLLRLPHHAFTQADFRASGHADFGEALKHWAHKKGLTQSGSYIVSVEGMWGGYASIQSAREFILASLLNSKDALRNLHQVTSSLDPARLLVAVHMRTMGDGFKAPSPNESVRGKFNIVIPGEWYLWVCEELRRIFRNRIDFQIFFDRPSLYSEEAIRRFNPKQIAQTGLTACSDLLLMAKADLRVCSVSSYSLAANFLSQGPFVWYEPQLTLHEGRYTLWGAEDSSENPPVLDSQSPSVSAENLATQEGDAPRATLATPMNIGDPLPDSLIELLDQKLTHRDPATNLLGYGSLPAAAVRSKSLMPAPYAHSPFHEVELIK